jgi:hypothetical protein
MARVRHLRLEVRSIQQAKTKALRQRRKKFRKLLH